MPVVPLNESPRPAFAVGDLVTLRSGSPPMTVVQRNASTYEVAVWEEECGEMSFYGLPGAALRKADGEPT